MKSSETIRIWLEGKAEEVGQQTLEQIAGFARDWRRIFGTKPVDQITFWDIKKLRTLRNGCSGARLNKERIYLRAFLRWCDAHDLLADSERLLVDWKKARDEVRRKYVEFDRTEIQRLARLAEEPMRGYILVAGGTGLRQGTVRKLRWEWINWDRQLLGIPAEAMKEQREITLPLTGAVWKWFERRRGESGLVFPDLPSKAVIWKRFRRLVKAAGLPAWASPHDLRRSFVANAFRAGASMATVKALGGWKSQSVLLSHYGTAAREDEARKLLENFQ